MDFPFIMYFLSSTCALSWKLLQGACSAYISSDADLFPGGRPTSSMVCEWPTDIAGWLWRWRGSKSNGSIWANWLFGITLSLSLSLNSNSNPFWPGCLDPTESLGLPSIVTKFVLWKLVLGYFSNLGGLLGILSGKFLKNKLILSNLKCKNMLKTPVNGMRCWIGQYVKEESKQALS